MKKIYLLMLLSSFAANAQIQGPEVNAGVRVLDEAGRPITNTQVRVWFDSMKTSNVFDGTKTEGVSGQSDMSGEFSATHKALGEFGVKVEKEGYYLGQDRVILDKHKDGKWDPFHQVIEVKLRKKGSPIPMYAKRLEYFEMPTTNSPVGYDLMAGDWVSPHGKGTTSDLVFTLQKEFWSGFDFNWDLSIKFSGEGNGWQAISPADESPQSELRFPRTAPAEGYAFASMFLGGSRGTRGSWETNSTTATNYFFRIRTEYDSNKQIKSALYGKLLGPIQVNVQHTKTARLDFTYYLNPTALDRNMEFDPKKNLFKNLTGMEQVQKP